jgi:hypothetical protein
VFRRDIGDETQRMENETILPFGEDISKPVMVTNRPNNTTGRKGPGRSTTGDRHT